MDKSYCPKCGKENAVGQKFCAACGSNLQEGLTEKQPATNSKKRLYIILGSVIGALVLIAIIVGITSYSAAHSMDGDYIGEYSVGGTSLYEEFQINGSNIQAKTVTYQAESDDWFSSTPASSSINSGKGFLDKKNKTITDKEDEKGEKLHYTLNKDSSITLQESFVSFTVYKSSTQKGASIKSEMEKAEKSK